MITPQLAVLGLTEIIISYLEEKNLSDFSVGRVIREHRERYIVSDGLKEYEAEITGNLRYSAESRKDFPAVGDWVAMIIYESGQALIHKVLPRKSILQRQAVGKTGEIQIISTNIDVAFIVQSIDNNFNINRLERYLTICYSSGIEPLLLLSKTDLASKEEINNIVSKLQKRDKKIGYILLSNKTLDGIDRVMENIQHGKTYCVVGSSGVGKSTLINNLLNKSVLKTGSISRSTNKGRHITEHRELFVLENGGIIIDTPGMRELGVTDNKEGINTTFEDIEALASDCMFPDCKHINEKGCAVISAVNTGIIASESYHNYLKIRKEQQRFNSTVAEKKKKDKAFGKMIKNYYKDMHRNKDF